MPTQSELLQKKLKEWYVKFGKTPFAIPVTLALTCLVFYASVAYLGGACLSNLLAPLFMLGMLWSINVRSVKKLLVIGVVAVTLFAVILCLFLVNSLVTAEPMILTSEDGKTISGTLSPWSGGPDTLFTYNLTIVLNDTREVNSARLLLFNLGQSGGHEFNYSMGEPTIESVNNSGVITRYFNYTYTTVLSTPINQFLFRANISGEWLDAGDFDDLGNAFYVKGPIYKDTWEVAKPLIPSAVQYSFIYIFIPYLMIIGMIWWTRRARRMRAENIERLDREREMARAEKPKEASKKVPSLASAMGKEEDTFVCSECGADVPADAEVCPKCGEKFD